MMAVNNQRVEEQSPFGNLTVIGEDIGSADREAPSGSLTVVGDDDGFTTRPLEEGVAGSEQAPANPLLDKPEISAENMADLDAAIAREDASGAVETPQESVETGIEQELSAQRSESASSTIEFLRGDVVDPETKESFGIEGFSQSTYLPAGDKSGITIATGVDLRGRSKAKMMAIGVPEDIAEKLTPYYGKADKSLEGQTPLTKEEADLVDKLVLEEELAEIREVNTTFDKLPQPVKNAVVMVKHQYNKTDFEKQIAKGQYEKALNNLLNWTDKTKDLGENIAKKYHAMGKLLRDDPSYQSLIELESYKKLKNGWYRDPDTGERFEIVDGERQ